MSRFLRYCVQHARVHTRYISDQFYYNVPSTNFSLSYFNTEPSFSLILTNFHCNGNRSSQLTLQSTVTYNYTNVRLTNFLVNTVKKAIIFLSPRMTNFFIMKTRPGVPPSASAFDVEKWIFFFHLCYPLDLHSLLINYFNFKINTVHYNIVNISLWTRVPPIKLTSFTL
jgi:hypothetical protein